MCRKRARTWWQRVTEMLRKQFPAAVPVMDAARDDVLAHSYGEDFVYLCHESNVLYEH